MDILKKARTLRAEKPIPIEAIDFPLGQIATGASLQHIYAEDDFWVDPKLQTQDILPVPLVTYGRVAPENHPAFGRRVAVFNVAAIAEWADRQGESASIPEKKLDEGNEAG